MAKYRRRLRKYFRKRKFQRRRPTFQKKKFRRFMKAQPLLFKQTCTVPVGTNTTGQFKLGINFNGAPGKSDYTKNAVVYTQDSVLNPLTYSDFDYFNMALGTGLAGIWAQCRLAAIKFRYIPQHSNDDSATVLPGNMFIKTDYMGEELTIQTITAADFYKGSFKILPTLRPWKKYYKSMKYKFNSKIPSPDPNVTGNNNQNLAGMWHGVNDSIGKSNASFGTHIQLLLDQATNSYAYGTIVVTGYWQLRDRY